jgi:hypothetical protein
VSEKLQHARVVDEAGVIRGTVEGFVVDERSSFIDSIILRDGVCLPAESVLSVSSENIVIKNESMPEPAVMSEELADAVAEAVAESLSDILPEMEPEAVLPEVESEAILPDIMPEPAEELIEEPAEELDEEPIVEEAV